MATNRVQKLAQVLAPSCGLLADAEAHHQREEEALFPELEHRVGFGEGLNELTAYLVSHLRAHIFKEDHILYPTTARP